MRSWYSGAPKTWRENGILHRLDGPAKIWPNGDKEWYQNGLLHRLDGPARIWADRYHISEWWVKGVYITEELLKNLIKNNISTDSKEWTDADWVWFRLWVSQF